MPTTTRFGTSRSRAPFLVTDASAVVHGEVRLTDFRDADGVAAPENGPAENWERFLMVLPKHPAGPAGAPVVVYGHGLMVSKETMVAVASDNARRGVATVGIDIPNHGERQDEGGFLLDIAQPETFGRLTSMTLQGEIDNLSMMRSVEQHFGDLRFETPLLGSAPPRLDPSRLLYEGTSMGGVLGAAEVPLASELDGAFLQVPGVGIVDIIVHSALWPLFMKIVPDGIPAGDAAALIGAASMLIDRSDAVNVLDADHTGDAPIFAQYGVGDGIVPGFATARLLTLLDLPLIGPELTPVPTPVRRLSTDEVPADGWGAQQVWNTQSSVELMALGGHLSFMDPVAQKLFDDWLVSRLAATGIGPPRLIGTAPFEHNGSAPSTVGRRDPARRRFGRCHPARASAVLRCVAHAVRRRSPRRGRVERVREVHAPRDPGRVGRARSGSGAARSRGADRGVGPGSPPLG